MASPQSAEDVVQEAWLGMLGGLARFEGRSSLRTWTFTILVNRARTWSSIDNSSRWDTAPENAALSREALRQLDRAVSALPARQRQGVTMRDIEGMSAEEACAALGLSAANQRVLLHRARSALRTALAGYYRG